MDTVDSAITKPVHRLEVFTGAGRRRTWSDEDKARVVAEIESSGASVSSVARRHGLSPQQLFGWRRQLRESEAIVCMADGPRFVPAVVVAPSSTIARREQRKSPRRHLAEHAINGVTVRIVTGVPADKIAAVMRALKAGA